MADEIKDVKISKEELEQASQYLKELAILRGVSVNELNLSRETIRSMAREIVEGTYKKDKELIKDINTLLKESIKEQKELKQAQQKQSQSFLTKLGFVEKPAQDQLAIQYKARQMAGGIESVMEGRFASGTRQILSTFPKIANFMGGPYFLAIQAVTSGLLKLDDAIARAKQQVLSSTGGIYSPFRGDTIGSLIYKEKITSDLRKYGLQDKASEISNSVFASTGMGAMVYGKGHPKEGEINPDLLSQRIQTQGAATRYLGSLGISDQLIASILKTNRNIEGMSEIRSQASLYRLAERFKSSRYMTEGEGAQQSFTLYEQLKGLGVNFEWASRTVRKFDEALQKGEVTLNDFAAVSRGIKGSDAGKAAGIASMLKDYAIRNNIILPKEFMEASDRGAGLYLQTRSGISNKNIQRGLTGLFREMSSGINYGSTTFDQAAAIQDLLRGIPNANITADMARNIVQTGNWSDIIGGRSEDSTQNIAVQSQKLLDEAKNYYKEERSYFKAFSDNIGEAFSILKTGVNVTIQDGQWYKLLELISPASGFVMRDIINKGENTINNNPNTITTGS